MNQDCQYHVSQLSISKRRSLSGEVLALRAAVHAGAFAGVSVNDPKTTTQQARIASAKLLTLDFNGTFAHCMAKKQPWDAGLEVPV